jgi:hypothetical protein
MRKGKHGKSVKKLCNAAAGVAKTARSAGEAAAAGNAWVSFRPDIRL